MAIEFGTGRAQIASSGAIQTFSVAGMTETVKLAVFRMVAAESNAASESHAVYMRGATDGVTDASIAGFADDGVTPTLGRNGGSVGPPGAANTTEGQAVRTFTTSNGSYSSAGTSSFFSSFGAGEVSLEFDRLPPDGDWYLEFALFGGSDFTATVDEVDLTGLVGGTTDHTELGVPADFLQICGYEATLPSVTSSRHSMVEGAWSRSAHSESGGVCVATAFGNASATSESVQIVLEDAIACLVDTDSPGGDLSNRVRALEHASGWTSERIDAVGGLGSYAVAMNFGGKKVAWVGVEDTATAVGLANIVSPLMSVDLAFNVVTRKDTVNVDDANEEDASVHGGGVAVPGVGAGFSMAHSSQHGVNPSVAKSYTDDRFLSIPRPDGLFGSGAVRASMIASIAGQGVQVQWNQVDTTARKWLLMTIGDSQTLDPGAVGVTLVVPSVSVAVSVSSSPVALTLVVPEPTVLGETSQTPSPVALTLVAPEPFTGFLFPAPAEIPVVAPEPMIIAPGAAAVPGPDLGDEYQRILIDLLPRGLLWTRALGTTFANLLRGYAEEAARVETRGKDLLEEADVRTTTELLSEWETWLGVEEDCAGLEDTVQERRFALVTKLTAQGGQNRFHFSEVAKALGFQIEVEDFVEYRQFEAGRSAAGDPLSNGAWVYAWTVVAPEATATFARAGVATAGEPIVTFGNELLECAFGIQKPAHTVVLFEFTKPVSGYAPWNAEYPDPVVISLAMPIPGVS